MADGACEDEADVVAPGTERALRVEVPAQKAVARLAELLPVHENSGERVAVFEAKDDGGVAKEGLRYVERARKGPVAPCDPLDALLVAAEKRVGHPPGGKKRAVDVAGHRRRAGERRAAFVKTVESPFAPEVETRKIGKNRGVHRRRF